MTLPLDRRAFLSGALALPLAAAAAGEAGARSAAPRRGSRIKLSCNLYSFNDPLTTGAMTLEQVIDYCAELGFDGVDPTGYYFKGYPAPAADAEVYRIKHLAFRAGLGISARDAVDRCGLEARCTGAAGLLRPRRARRPHGA
jgi:hypothetical protein